MDGKNYVFNMANGMFYVATKEFWNTRFCFDDRDLGLQIPEFEEVAESSFHYIGTGGMQEGRRKLLGMGMESVRFSAARCRAAAMKALKLQRGD